MCKINHILSVIHYTICGAVCFQFTHFSCDDWDNVYTLSYHHHQIGSMNYYPLFRVRSWNNAVRCMSFYILMVAFNPSMDNLYKNMDKLYDVKHITIEGKDDTRRGQSSKLQKLRCVKIVLLQQQSGWLAEQDPTISQWGSINRRIEEPFRQSLQRPSHDVQLLRPWQPSQTTNDYHAQITIGKKFLISRKIYYLLSWKKKASVTLHPILQVIDLIQMGILNIKFIYSCVGAVR